MSAFQLVAQVGFSRPQADTHNYIGCAIPSLTKTPVIVIIDAVQHYVIIYVKMNQNIRYIPL